ncbi:hypothetical protein [Streptomyces sp. UNOB3_S3]|uniref:hypothetical protein n=1 Tax=Streptomyces sp. UNOB3_S3 TaxID=2871682 RepID=UPI001E38407F|nr:hypothetical protein [Streptomyces sp. UNOB3_S3]MCC3773322.1 hypothetical protein [Streptomyces sp. UNOB3_S3]
MSGTSAAPGNSPDPLPDCATDPITSLVAELVDKRMGGRIAQGQDPVLRPVFVKFHGVACGVLTVAPDLPPDLSIGFLRAAKEQKGLAAWVRFSSDVLPDRPDLRRRGDLQYRLASGEDAFDLLLQFRTDPDSMPLDRALGRISERPGEGGEADPAPAGRHGLRPGGLRGQLRLQPLAQPARAPAGR